MEASSILNIFHLIQDVKINFDVKLFSGMMKSRFEHVTQSLPDRKVSFSLGILKATCMSFLFTIKRVHYRLSGYFITIIYRVSSSSQSSPFLLRELCENDVHLEKCFIGLLVHDDGDYHHIVYRNFVFVF